MNSVLRLTYALGWVFAALSLICRGLQVLGVEAVNKLPASPRGILFFACFLFLAAIASAAYGQVQASTGKGRGTAA